MDIRALAQGVGLFAVELILTSLILPIGRPLSGQSVLWFAVVVFTSVLSLGGGAYLVLFKTHGLHQRRFWRALGTKDNFPFTPLREMLARDLQAARRLEVYSLPILMAAKDRFSLMEETLRGRLGNLFGNTSLLVLFGLLGAIWSAWRNYSTQGGPGTIAMLGGSILMFLAALYAARLSLSLAELTRCRTLLSLEIARRSFDNRGEQK